MVEPSSDRSTRVTHHFERILPCFKGPKVILSLRTDAQELEEITSRVAPGLLPELHEAAFNPEKDRIDVLREFVLAAQIVRAYLNDYSAGSETLPWGPDGADNITNHNYGTVNNVGHVENATFNASRTSSSTHNPTRPSSYTKSEKPPDGSASPPHHSFVIFALTYLKTHQPAEATHFSEPRVNSIITAAWALIPPEDRTKIEEDPERAELHMAMLGGAGKGARGERQKEKYWNFTGSMIDFWSQKWQEVQVKAKRHATALGKTFLGMSFGSQGSSSGDGGCGRDTGKNAEGRKGAGGMSGEGHSLPSIMV